MSPDGEECYVGCEIFNSAGGDEMSIHPRHRLAWSQKFQQRYSEFLMCAAVKQLVALESRRAGTFLVRVPNVTDTSIVKMGAIAMVPWDTCWDGERDCSCPLSSHCRQKRFWPVTGGAGHSGGHLLRIHLHLFLLRQVHGFWWSRNQSCRARTIILFQIIQPNRKRDEQRAAVSPYQRPLKRGIKTPAESAA